MVLVRHHGRTRALLVGPLTNAGLVTYGEGAELLWIKFKLGTLMPHLPTRNFLNRETLLPEAANQSFWLNGSVWQLPDFEHADVFVNRLVRAGLLMTDPVVSSVLEDGPRDLSPRTLRHRFLKSTGLTQTHIRQVERAQRAAALLENGVAIQDAVFDAGYFDQPHLTRSLKQWIGHTPAHILRTGSPE
jgi:Helix-turn-helix domain